MTPDDALLHALTEIKHLERRWAKTSFERGQLEDQIKAALRGGDRDRALQRSLQLEDLKAKQHTLEHALQHAKRHHASLRAKVQDLSAAQRRAALQGELARAFDQLTTSLETLSAADDVLADLDQQQALAQARLDVAADGAHPHTPDPTPPPPSTAEDLLAEIERDLDP